jgi:hypothetical protein
MNTLRKIQTGLAIALVSAFAFAAGSSSAKADVPIGEAAAAVELSLDCTMSGPTATGREWAKLVRSYVRKGVVYCTRVRVGGEAPVEIAHCGERKYELGCDVVLD